MQAQAQEMHGWPTCHSCLTQRSNASRSSGVTAAAGAQATIVGSPAMRAKWSSGLPTNLAATGSALASAAPMDCSRLQWQGMQVRGQQRACAGTQGTHYRITEQWKASPDANAHPAWCELAAALPQRERSVS